MANKIDINTIAKEYAAGRISKEDFLYLHKMLTDPSAKKPGQQPPVLTPAQQPAQQQVRNKTAQQRQRRIVRPPDNQQVHASQQNTRMQPARRATIPPQLQNSSGVSTFGYIRKHHKEVVALLGTLGIFISMFYNKMHVPPADEGNSRVVMVQQTNENHSPRIRTQDIKLIAQLMMEDNGWNKELIDDFVTQWNKLTHNEKASIKQSDWYLDFSAMLSQQIKTTRIKAKTGDVAAIYNQQALLSLADNLVFGDNQKAQKLLAEAAKSNIEKPATLSKQKHKPDVQTQKPVEKIAPQTKTTTVIEAKSKKSSQPLERHRISRKEIEDMLNRLTVAFEAGQSNDLTALFADADYSSSFASLNKVKKQYKDLFKSTRDRQLDLNSFFWEHDYDEVRGTAKYKAKVRMKDANIDKTITANLDITLRRLLGKIYITDFKLKDEKVVSSSPKFKQKLQKKLAVKVKPKHPTPSELQDLVTQYVTAYETGDVKELMQLFSNATWTKSRTGLVEMKQNYENLFLTTSGREVFIKNIDWQYKGDKALGTGELLVTLHNKENQVETKKGKIRIVAKKSKDLVRFTQMFHIVE